MQVVIIKFLQAHRATFKGNSRLDVKKVVEMYQSGKCYKAI